MKVVIIGTGNVATVLGTIIMQSGHEIVQVIGRKFEETNALSHILSSTSAYNTRYVNLLADIYIIAVADSWIASVAQQIRLKDQIIVHMAASVSKNVLANSSQNYGVIYPLQTLKKGTSVVFPVPVLIDGSNENTIKTLREFSEKWAENVVIATDEERLKLHVAAVFVNNFTNHILAVAEEYCKKEQLNFNLLLPLLKETIERVRDDKPSALQTGPAVRKDTVTIEKHKNVLAGYPEYLSLYNAITNSILHFYNNPS